jgi:N-acetylneuraminic acid mutarotase
MGLRKKAETLQVALLCDSEDIEGGAHQESIPRDALKALVDDVVLTIRRVAAIGGFTFDGEMATEDTELTNNDGIYVFDLDKNTWSEFTRNEYNFQTDQYVDTPVKLPAMLFQSTNNGLMATTLHDGSSLLATGDDDLSDKSIAYFFKPADPYVQFDPFSLADARKYISRVRTMMVTLLDGRVLRFGGYVRYEAERAHLPVRNAIYDPSTEKWTEVYMRERVNGEACCIVMDDGNVLLSGGMSNGASGKQCLILDVKTWKQAYVADMIFQHSNHAGCLLPNGEVFICGGMSHRGRRTFTCEIYNPAANKWRLARDMYTPRWDHTCISLGDGRVFIGGDSRNKMQCEIYDTDTQKSELVPVPPVGLIDYAIVPIYN